MNPRTQLPAVSVLAVLMVGAWSYVLLVPPVGIAAAWVLQGETPGVVELAGGAVMLLGVAAATVAPRRTGGDRRSPATPAAARLPG